MTKQVISIKMEPNQAWTYRLDVRTAPERGHALGIRSYRMMQDYAAFFRFHYANDGDVNRAEWHRLFGGL